MDVKRIASSRTGGRPQPRQSHEGPSALTGLGGNALGLLLVAAASYAIIALAHYAEARGWSLRQSLILECSLSGALAALAGVIWAASQRLKLIASWLCLASLVHVVWAGWILLNVIYPGLVQGLPRP